MQLTEVKLGRTMHCVIDHISSRAYNLAAELAVACVSIRNLEIKSDYTMVKKTYILYCS